MDNFMQLQADTLEELKKVTKSIEQFREIYTNVKTHELKEETKGVRVIEQKGVNDAIMTVKEFDSAHVGDISIVDKLNHAQQIGMKMRQLEIQLRGGTVVFEGGQFMYSSGQLKQERVDISLKEVIRGVIRRQEGDTFFRPSMSGTGTVVLDGSFNFITLFPIATPSRVVLEKGIYLASIGNFEFRTTKNLQAGYFFFSENSLLQSDVRGTGILALELPVPMDSLVEYEVTEHEPFRVDGNYVLMWSGNLKKTVVPAHGVLGSLTSGTGMVEEYTGTGKVWVAPLLDYYNILKENHLDKLNLAGAGEEAETPPAQGTGNLFQEFLARFRSRR